MYFSVYQLKFILHLYYLCMLKSYYIVQIFDSILVLKSLGMPYKDNKVFPPNCCFHNLRAFSQPIESSRALGAYSTSPAAYKSSNSVSVSFVTCLLTDCPFQARTTTTTSSNGPNQANRPQVDRWQGSPKAARHQGCSQIRPGYRWREEASPLPTRYRGSS